MLTLTTALIKPGDKLDVIAQSTVSLDYGDGRFALSLSYFLSVSVFLFLCLSLSLSHSLTERRHRESDMYVK